MFLAVTPLEEFWDKSDDLLFIGPWCALYERRAEWSRLKHRFAPDPWADAAEMSAAAQHCRVVSERLLDRLSAYLGEALKIKRGRKAWRILLDPWLTYHVEQMYDHYVHVESALRIEPSPRTILLDVDSYDTPRSTDDFARMMLGHPFHLQMYSHILACKLPGQPSRPLPPPERPRAPIGFKPMLKQALASALAACAPAWTGDVLLGEVGLNRKERLKLIRASRFAALPYMGELPASSMPAPVMNAARLGLAELPASDDFERIFISGLPRHLPTLFMEGHDDAVRFTRSRLHRTPKAVFTNVDWHYTDSFKFAAAECSDRGAELWGLQHGGGYGMVDYTPAENIERDISDRYYCWGWSKTESDARLRDLPPPALSRNGKGLTGDGVLLVSTALDLHSIRLVMNNSLSFDYLDRQVRLLRALPDDVASRTRVRLHKIDRGWMHRERILEARPETGFDDSNIPFSRSLRACRLAVFDCPSTPLLEAMAADVPSVLCWRRDAWPMRESAVPFIERLRNAGILFESPEGAAAQIGRAYPDPRAWWDAPERRSAREAFTETFARSTPRWLEAWLKELREASWNR